MRDVLLINPNTSAATTAMMVAIARKAAPADMRIRGATAPRGAPMILDDAMLAASVSEVLALARRHAATVDGIVIAAFGDPGLAALRSELTIPVVGIAESAMLTAAAGGRRFGVATVTPGLADAIAARAAALGLAASYTGIRLTDGDPQALAAQTDRLIAALAEAVERCIAQDGAQAVIIGGGPLGRAAIALAPLFDIPIIAPIPAAIRRLVA